jgi:hypothetical protein
MKREGRGKKHPGPKDVITPGPAAAAAPTKAPASFKLTVNSKEITHG